MPRVHLMLLALSHGVLAESNKIIVEPGGDIRVKKGGLIKLEAPEAAPAPSSPPATPPFAPAVSAPEFRKLGNGYCDDWLYLPTALGGRYPARLPSGDPLAATDPVQECANRCKNAEGSGLTSGPNVNGGVGGASGHAVYDFTMRAFYVALADAASWSEGGCACSSGPCSSLIGTEFDSYALGPAPPDPRYWGPMIELPSWS